MDILDSRSPMRASEAAKRAHEFFEVSLARNPSDYKIECAKGCHFCCILRVSAMAPEIFHIANYIRREHAAELESVLECQRAAEANSHGLTNRERAKKQFHCGLLVDKACSVYKARPSACRAMTSISVKTCEEGYNGKDVQVLTPAVWTVLRNLHNQAMWAAFTAAGLPITTYELNHAVLIALENPDAEARWLNREDVFSGVSSDPPQGAAEEARKKHIIERIVLGAQGKELPPEPQFELGGVLGLLSG